MAATLSVMFRSPLFGFIEGQEMAGGEVQPERSGDKSNDSKALYCIAVGAGFGCFYLLNRIFKASEGFPSFDVISPGRADYVLSVLYLICGVALGIFFEYSEMLFKKMGEKVPGILSEMLAGAVLGIFACILPVVKFSGEEQMAVLISDYAVYAPAAMIGIAFLKVVLTNMCIQLGLKGGHFFPLIFSAVCLGYGIALLLFPGDGSHATFAAAVVAAGTLGVTMKKPLAVSMLLLLCFPVRSLLWIVPASAIASLVGNHLGEFKSTDMGGK